MVSFGRTLNALFLSLLSVWSSVPVHAGLHVETYSYSPTLEDSPSKEDSLEKGEVGSTTNRVDSPVETESGPGAGEVSSFVYPEKKDPQVSEGEKQRRHTLWASVRLRKLIFFVLAVTTIVFLKTLFSGKKSEGNSFWEDEDENKQEDEKKDDTTKLIEDNKKEEEKKEKESENKEEPKEERKREEPRNREERKRDETHRQEVTKESRDDDAKNNLEADRKIIKESDERRSEGDNRVMDQERENENREDEERREQLSNRRPGGITPSEDVEDNKDRQEEGEINEEEELEPQEKSNIPIVTKQSREHDKNDHMGQSSKGSKTNWQKIPSFNLDFSHVDVSKLKIFSSLFGSRSGDNTPPGGGTGSGMGIHTPGSKTAIGSGHTSGIGSDVPSLEDPFPENTNVPGSHTGRHNHTPHDSTSRIIPHVSDHNNNADSGVDPQLKQNPGNVKTQSRETTPSETTPLADMNEGQKPRAKQDTIFEEDGNKDTSSHITQKQDETDVGGNEQGEADDGNGDGTQENQLKTEKDGETRKQSSWWSIPLGKIFNSGSSLVRKTGNLVKRGATFVKEKVANVVSRVLSPSPSFDEFEIK